MQLANAIKELWTRLSQTFVEQGGKLLVERLSIAFRDSLEGSGEPPAESLLARCANVPQLGAGFKAEIPKELRSADWTFKDLGVEMAERLESIDPSIARL